MTRVQVIGFLLVLGILIFTLIILMFVKGYYHFQYLKLLHPKKLERYVGYGDIFFSTAFFNVYRFSLLFPCFTRKVNKEVSSDIKNTVRKVVIFSRLIYIFLVLLIILVSSIIIIYRDANVEL